MALPLKEGAVDSLGGCVWLGVLRGDSEAWDVSEAPTLWEGEWVDDEEGDPSALALAVASTLLELDRDTLALKLVDPLPLTLLAAEGLADGMLAGVVKGDSEAEEVIEASTLCEGEWVDDKEGDPSALALTVASTLLELDRDTLALKLADPLPLPLLAAVGLEEGVLDKVAQDVREVLAHKLARLLPVRLALTLAEEDCDSGGVALCVAAGDGLGGALALCTSLPDCVGVVLALGQGEAEALTQAVPAGVCEPLPDAVAAGL